MQRGAFRNEVAKLTEQVVSLREDVTEARTDKANSDKEQEDLLVLLEELSAKRKADKVRMRAAQLDVSDDEEDDDDDSDEDE